jgi:HlyD family secretion protein
MSGYTEISIVGRFPTEKIAFHRHLFWLPSDSTSSVEDLKFINWNELNGTVLRKVTSMDWSTCSMKRLAKKLIPVFFLAIIGTAVGWHVFNGKVDSVETLTLYGNVEIREAQLAFKEQDRITAILVDEGDRVSCGHMLAQLDTERLKAQINMARASIEAQSEVVKRLEKGTRREVIEEARSKVKASEARYKHELEHMQRIRQTTAVQATSQQHLDDARARVEVEKAQLNANQQALDLALAGPQKETILEAKARLKALEGDLSLLKIRYRDMSLRSPAEGVVRSRLLEPGEMAGPNSPVLTLALTDPKWVRTYVSEPNLGHIHAGMAAKVIGDSFQQEAFTGWIGFISSVAEFTPRSVETVDLRSELVYEVRVFVKDPYNHLRLGAPVTVTLDPDGKSRA